MAILKILGVILGATKPAKNISKERGNPTAITNNLATHSTGEKTKSTKIKIITMSISTPGFIVAGIGIVIVIAFSIWAFGCGNGYKGQIDQDLESLKTRRIQIERRLI